MTDPKHPNFEQAILNSLDIHGKTILHSIVALNQEAAALSLIEKMEKNTLFLKTPGDGYTALHLAAQTGNTAIISHLLLKGGKELARQVDNYGQTPLHWAVHKGHDKAVEILVQEMYQDDLAIANYENGYTALHFAAQNGHFPITHLLLAKKTSGLTSFVDKYGQTPLHWAADRCHEQVVAALLEEMFKEDLTLQTNEKGCTALHFAALKNNLVIIQLLMQYGGKKLAEVVDVNGKTAEEYAVSIGHQNIADAIERLTLTSH